MARYIDEKDVYKLVEPTGVARVHCSQIDELPRADVVPKIEVEKIIAEWAYLHADVLNKLENAKVEVSRVIFEEIETCMKNFEDDDDGYLLKKCEFEFFMRELKKIYAEEKE